VFPYRVSARILFFDDDLVVRVLRTILSNERDPWIAEYFAPERIDLARLLRAGKGLRTCDGAVIGHGGDGSFKNASAIIFRRGEIGRAFMVQHPRLKLIQRLGERPDGIDLLAAKERGIRVSCLPRRTLIYTAEHGMLLMLALAKRLLAADRAVREGSGPTPPSDQSGNIVYNWAAFNSTGLYGKTLGIVGMGEVGFLLAKRASAFGMSIVYTKRRRATPDQEAAVGAQFVTENELLGSADFVSLMLPNLPDYARYAGSQFFARMRPDAFFINMSRGALVDEDALYEALRSARIAGAALDVHAIEPRPAEDRFAKLENIVMTPHLAGGAKSGLLDEYEVIVNNCHAALRGEAIRHEVLA
jgi:phosphoglycerate dehydrogenase-like enzyme